MLAQLAKAVGAPGRAGPSLTILIVDDSHPDRDYLAWQLSKVMESPPLILEAETAADALAILARRTVDVMLVDYLLPDMNGLDLLGRIVDEAQGAAVLLMSGQGSERVAAEAIKHGAHDYFVKQGASGEQLKRLIGQAVDAARRNREERASFQRLDRAHQELDHFVRALSHDMKANFMLLDHSFRELRQSYGRTPLDGLTEGFSHVEACLRQSRRFLDDLVTLARTGQITMEPARVELTRVVREVLYEQRELIDDRHATVDVAPDLPAVWCNEDRIKQVVTNMVRNALKHGCDRLSPAVRISRVEPRDGEVRFVWLSIHDNGPGIPVASREEIFLPGRRLPGAHETGSGMGLAIVRKIVEYYGGQAFVDPLSSQGTAFVVTLPGLK
ncbi:MAG TPA: hybrid sensor histidine kinase/response regulator [Pirellulales bacterium]|jgi:signal transduction histidine kinase|nr:hybrid sensor histidine kinase/response regulator [Pirellulales bacterium]